MMIKRFILALAVLLLGTGLCLGQSQFKLPLPDGTEVDAVYLPGYIVTAGTAEGGAIILNVMTVDDSHRKPKPKPNPTPVVVVKQLYGIIFEAGRDNLTKDQIAALTSAEIPKYMAAHGGGWRVLSVDATLPADLKTFLDACNKTTKPCLIVSDKDGNVVLNETIVATGTEADILTKLKKIGGP